MILYVCSIGMIALGVSMVLAGVVRPMSERAIWTGTVFILWGGFMLGVSVAVSA